MEATKIGGSRAARVSVGTRGGGGEGVSLPEVQVMERILSCQTLHLPV